MLTVTGLSGRMKALYGAFEPAQKTQGGCQCAQLWSYRDSSDQTVSVRGQCVNPGGAHARAWCQYEPESCTGSEYPLMVCQTDRQQCVKRSSPDHDAVDGLWCDTRLPSKFESC